MTMQPGIAVRTLAMMAALWAASSPASLLAQTTKAEADTKEKGKAKVELVELNTATEEQLATLPGVGPSLAKSIVEGRPYSSLADLDKVKGMGESKIAAIKDLVGFKPAPASASPATPRAKAETTKTTAAPKGKAALLGGKKININTASSADLQMLTGVGPARAQAIIDGRPYDKIEDIMKVKGIKNATFDKLKESITVK